MSGIKQTILLIAFIFNCSVLLGHPSWGIAVAVDGTVYFADVMHNGIGTIWKIAPDGQAEPYITDFHAHHLQVDSSGDLWIAENRWIQGLIEGEGENKLIMISVDGKQETVLFTDDSDEFFGGSFAMSNNNSVYFAYKKKVWEKPFEEDTRLLIDHEFQRIVTLFSDDNSNLWITDKGYKNGTLFKWNPESGLNEFANGLIPKDPEDPIFPEERFHLLYGIAVDDSNHVYVADNAHRKITRIDKNKNRIDYYRSDAYWYPAGLDFHEGNTYILEVGYRNEHLGPRVIKIDNTGNKSTIFDYEVYKKSR